MNLKLQVVNFNIQLLVSLIFFTEIFSDHNSLVTREELFCAANVLTHLGAGYINDQNYGAPERVFMKIYKMKNFTKLNFFQLDQNNFSSVLNERKPYKCPFIPEQIAIPWWGVCEKLKIVPTLTDYIAANCNWTLHDPEKPAELENLKSLFTFTETRGYEWEMGLNVIYNQTHQF